MKTETSLNHETPPIANVLLAVRSCVRCKKVLENKRKKFCSDSCKFWFNSIKKDNEKHLPPVKKRTELFFYMVTGSERAKSNSRQGKRSGGMITGSMSAMIYCTVEEIVELNQENINRHFKGIQGYTPSFIRLGTNKIIRKENVFSRLGFSVE